jgi:hypothetical protein
MSGQIFGGSYGIRPLMPPQLFVGSNNQILRNDSQESRTPGFTTLNLAQLYLGFQVSTSLGLLLERGVQLSPSWLVDRFCIPQS